MDLADEFEVPLALEDAWRVLTDLQRVAPCLPGAQLDEVEGEEYRGRVRVKVGPITVEYKGAAHFTSTDASSHVAELHAEGREARGQGAASANVRAALSEVSPGRTKVVVNTSLEVSGKVAQFGRGALADVSARLMRQFVENLERDLTSGTEAPASAEALSADGAAPATQGPAQGAATSSAQGSTQQTAPISAVRLVGPVLLKRLVPPVVLGAIALLIRRWRARARA